VTKTLETIQHPGAALRCEHHKARGRSQPERTRLYVRIGDDRERGEATHIGAARYWRSIRRTSEIMINENPTEMGRRPLERESGTGGNGAASLIAVIPA